MFISWGREGGLCCRAEFHIRRLNLLIWAASVNSYGWNQLSQSRKIAQFLFKTSHSVSIWSQLELKVYFQRKETCFWNSDCRSSLILHIFTLQCKEGELLVKGHLKRGFLRNSNLFRCFIPGAEDCYALQGKPGLTVSGIWVVGRNVYGFHGWVTLSQALRI